MDSNPRHMYMQENVWEVIFFTHLKVKVIFSLEALLVLGPSTVDERAVCVCVCVCVCVGVCVCVQFTLTPYIYYVHEKEKIRQSKAHIQNQNSDYRKINRAAFTGFEPSDYRQSSSLAPPSPLSPLPYSPLPPPLLPSPPSPLPLCPSPPLTQGDGAHGRRSHHVVNILDLTEFLRQQDIALVGQLLWFPWIRPFLLHCIDVEVVTLLEIHHLHHKTQTI